ncbi:MAG: phosphopantetheine-binding protein [Puniceicoccaceae bacterium]
MSESIHERLKQIIVETLNLDDVVPEEIANDKPLFETGLGLDSIDVLELVVRIEKEYQVKIENSEAAKQALQSVNSLATYIEAARQ